MHRIFALILSVTALVALTTSSVAANTESARGQFGKSLDEWQKLYWTWAFGGPQDEPVVNVRFLPLPSSSVEDYNPETKLRELIGVQSVRIGPGQGFVLPVLAYGGESYADGSQDDPAFPDFSLFTEQRVLVTLDGRSIIDSEIDDLNDFTFGPVFFDEPIEYAEPQERNGRLAVALVWVKGIGFVHQPLPVGEHTLLLYAELEEFGIAFRNTWNITVSRE
jgi:hypothetical protein